MTDDVFADGEARILDRGFRHHDGPRDRWMPYRSVFVHSVQRGLGLRRQLAAKVLPFVAIVVAFVPAIVLIGLASRFRSGSLTELELPSYGDYTGSILVAVLLLTALVAPEVFGNDQRNGMLGIYLASPLTRGTYLAAKSAAVAAVLTVVTAGPQLLLLVANTVQERGPQSVGDWLVVLLRVLASGVAVGVLLAALSVAVTVVTNNKGIATAGIVVLLLVVSGVAAGVAEVAGSNTWLVLSPLDVVFTTPLVIHGEPLPDNGIQHAAVVWAGLAAWCAGCGLLAWLRMRRLEVTR